MNNDKSELDMFEAAFDFGDNSEPSGNTNANLRNGDLLELLKILGDGQESESEKSRKSETISQKTVQTKLSEKKIIRKEDVIYTTEKPISEKAKTAHRKVIDGVELAVSSMTTEKKHEEQEQAREKLREYTKNADMEKIVFRKPRTESNFLPKFIMFICVCVAVGIALGLQSNSYYNYMASIGNKTDSTMSCLWFWLLEEGMPFSPFPLDSSELSTFLTQSGFDNADNVDSSCYEYYRKLFFVLLLAR